MDRPRSFWQCVEMMTESAPVVAGEAGEGIHERLLAHVTVACCQELPCSQPCPSGMVIKRRLHMHTASHVRKTDTGTLWQARVGQHTGRARRQDKRAGKAAQVGGTRREAGTEKLCRHTWQAGRPSSQGQASLL